MGSFGDNKGKFVFLGYFAAFGAAILGGLLPTVSKPLLDLVNPLLFTTIVTFAPAILFTPISARSKENKHIRKQGYAILAASAIASGLVAPYIYFVGLQESTAADAALLGNGEMVFTVLIATMFFGERLGRKGFLALMFLTFGIIAVITGLQFSSTSLDFAAPGHILILAATFLWGVDNNVTSAVTERVDVARIIQIKSLISGVGLFVIAYFLHELVVKNTIELLYVFIFGVFIFSGTAFLSIQALKRLGPITTTIVFPMTSVFGLLFAYVILGERITVLQIGSVIVILFGIYLLTRPGSVIREGINLEQI